MIKTAKDMTRVIFAIALSNSTSDFKANILPSPLIGFNLLNFGTKDLAENNQPPKATDPIIADINKVKRNGKTICEISMGSYWADAKTQRAMLSRRVMREKRPC